jgi:23S rRNA pseudouridine1911/1915/1917 synthase
MAEEKHSFKVSEEEEGRRLDHFCVKFTDKISRTYSQELIRSGNVLVNSRKRKPHYRVRAAELVEVTIPEPRQFELLAESLPLDIVYEDQELLVVNKPAGMVVHPACGHRSGTLVNALLAHTEEFSAFGVKGRPGIVHRLDKDTSGLLVVAKNEKSMLDLGEQIQSRKAVRKYLALVCGRLPDDSGAIEFPIGRSPRDRKTMAVTYAKSREAATSYEVKKIFSLCDFVEVSLKTGRTHQIRVHFSFIGHPVLGDPSYGGRQKWVKSLPGEERKEANRLLKQIDRQALHAYYLSFTHPTTKETLEFNSDLPEDMKEALEFLKGALE